MGGAELVVAVYGRGVGNEEGIITGLYLACQAVLTTHPAEERRELVRRALVQLAAEGTAKTSGHKRNLNCLQCAGTWKRMLGGGTGWKLQCNTVYYRIWQMYLHSW